MNNGIINAMLLTSVLLGVVLGFALRQRPKQILWIAPILAIISTLAYLPYAVPAHWQPVWFFAATFITIQTVAQVLVASIARQMLPKRFGLIGYWLFCMACGLVILLIIYTVKPLTKDDIVTIAKQQTVIKLRDYPHLKITKIDYLPQRHGNEYWSVMVLVSHLKGAPELPDVATLSLQVDLNGKIIGWFGEVE